MDHKRRHPHGRKNTADLDLAVHAHQRGHGGRARAEPLVASPPALEGSIRRARGRKSLHAAAGAPCLLDIAEECRECRFGRKPVGEARKAAVERQRAATIRIGRGKQDGQRRAFGNPQQRCLLHAGRIHHRAEIVHTLIEAGKLGYPIRHSGAALVEGYYPGVAAQTVQKAGEVGLVPIILDVRYEAWNHDQIDRAIAKRLIGDVNVAALGVLRNRLHGRLPLARISWRLRLRVRTIANKCRARERPAFNLKMGICPQRRLALNFSSAAEPGQSAFSSSWLSGVSTVSRWACRSSASGST